MPYVTVHVDADDVLSDLDTEDIVKELEKRDAEVIGLGDDSSRRLAHKLWEAFYLKKPEARVLELARELATAATGRMIP